MSVSDNEQRQRYEYAVEGRVAFIDYRRRDGVVTMTHAEVPPELEGRGIGTFLARGAMELVRARGEKVVPACSFVAEFLRRNSDYQDLLAAR